MERLTLDEAITHAKEVAEEKYNEGFLCHANPDDGKLDKCVKCAQEHEQLAEWLTQLKEYQQLEKQGRLVILPCKVGDVVYFTHHDRVISSEVLSAKYHAEAENHGVFIRKRLTIDVEGVSAEIDFGDIGRRVFLIKSEAEAKLKELRGGEHE